MEFEDVIKDRRSIREYLDKDVNKRIIAQILDAGRHAPSSGNVQNWRFIVVENVEKKKDIAVSCLKQIWMVQAPVFIVVCNKIEDVEKLYGEKGIYYSTQNCAACIENMLLAATSLGLAACWVGAFDEEAIIRILKIPESIKVEGIITLGYGDEKPSIPIRNTLNFITYFEGWGNIDYDFTTFPIMKHKEKIKRKIKRDFKYYIFKIKNWFSKE